MRAWTDQGRLRCLRINARGDRRYRAADLQAFLHDAGLQSGPCQPFTSRFRAELSQPVRAARGGGLVRLNTVAPLRGGTSRESAVAMADHFPVSTVAAVARPGARAGVTTISAPIPLRADRQDGAATRDHGLITEIRDQLRGHSDLQAGLRQAAASLLDSRRFRTVAIAEWRNERLVPHVVDGASGALVWLETADPSMIAVSLREGRSVAVPTVRPSDPFGLGSSATVTVYTPIGAAEARWGVLIAEVPSDGPVSQRDLQLLDGVASAVEIIARSSVMSSLLKSQQRRTDALAAIATELNSQLELPALMDLLVQRSMPLFDADRAAVWRIADGKIGVEASYNLSRELTEAVRGLKAPPIELLASMDGGVLVLRDMPNDSRSDELREVIEREGFHTVGVAPLLADSELIGLLAIYHDQQREWPRDELDLLRALGTQAGIAMRNAKNYQLMATWAAQLQSIQQLGTRLNRWGSVTGIGQAIAAELRQLIDYHNVRVYRVHGGELEPVAWRGDIGEYTDEERDQLRLRVGQGITGWVAQNGTSEYLADAARDPRSQTIPGTEDDLEESMLIAPMLYEDHVIGVIVLSKLGLNQFTGDDLRYLEIYASIAAQAMVNADATEQVKAQSDRLARQLSSQRELMQVTESILSTLDPSTVVEEIADRLSGLLRVDNIAIGIHDAEAAVVRTLFARGLHSAMYMDVVIGETEGVAGWVLQHGEALLIPRTQDDARFINFAGRVLPGAVIVAPLRSRDKVTGTLLLERLGEDARFEEEEFELLQLFAGHVSIALQNAQAHQAVEIRAQTDALTGLKNQGTFQEHLQLIVKRGDPFSLLIVDLDDFKAFNDKRGHEAGNLLLTGIARALAAACRESDEVFRYGGDEFALILPNTEVVGALEVAVKVGRAIRNARSSANQRLAGVTCSVGVAAFPVDASDRESILLAADRACYVAKRNGRNRAVTAAEALALAGDVLPEGPSPVDDPELAGDFT